MKILVLNVGSSSIKFELFESKGWKSLYEGMIDRVRNHQKALKSVFSELLASGTLNDMKEIDAIGHRIVHGGEYFKQATKITPSVLKRLRSLNSLAPLHNPHNIAGVVACQTLLPKKPNIAVFDTAFHSTIPERAFRYGVPEVWYKKYGIRRYGFHGSSHKYVAGIAAKKLGKKNLRIISCHLGNGQSVTAIRNGKSVDTSMGFTPLEGLMMGTRCGDIDPGIIFHLLQKKKWKPEKLYSMLNHESGLLGIFGKSSDMRDIYAAQKKGNKRAQLAMDMMVYRLQKYIGAYTTILGGLDVLIFTGGIGENAAYIRKAVCKGIKPKVMVIPSNEELQIAKDTLLCLR